MDDNVASLSSMSLSLTTFGGLALIMDKPEPENAFNPTMVGIGIIVVNCIMICVTVGNIFVGCETPRCMPSVHAAALADYKSYRRCVT